MIGKHFIFTVFPNKHYATNMKLLGLARRSVYDAYRSSLREARSNVRCTLTYTTNEPKQHIIDSLLESLILAQDERWRRVLHMQVERDI